MELEQEITMKLLKYVLAAAVMGVPVAAYAYPDFGPIYVASEGSEAYFQSYAEWYGQTDCGNFYPGTSASLDITGDTTASVYCVDSMDNIQAEYDFIMD